MNSFEIYKKKFKDTGFFVVEDFFTEEEIDGYRVVVENFFNTRDIKTQKGGRGVAGWVGLFEEFKELSDLVTGSRFSEMLTGVVFGDENWRFLGHSDF